MNPCNQTRFFILLSVLFVLSGCGFHLRGAFSIPPFLHVLNVSPNQPFDPFQRALIRTLKSNKIEVVDISMAKTKGAALLTLFSQAFSERTIAYGSDGQPNRAILELKITYQLTDPQGKVIVSDATVEVERELTLNPNAVLGTQNERNRLQSDLHLDAASQLVRQLSTLPTRP
jgi:LPS-assembly lipoprotein